MNLQKGFSNKFCKCLKLNLEKMLHCAQRKKGYWSALIASELIGLWVPYWHKTMVTQLTFQLNQLPKFKCHSLCGSYHFPVGKMLIGCCNKSALVHTNATFLLNPQNHRIWIQSINIFKFCWEIWCRIQVYDTLTNGQNEVD